MNEFIGTSYEDESSESIKASESSEVSQDEIKRIEYENATRYVKEEGIQRLNDLGLETEEFRSLVDVYSVEIDDLIEQTLNDILQDIIPIQIGVDNVVGYIDGFISTFLTNRISLEFDEFLSGQLEGSGLEEFFYMCVKYLEIENNSNFLEDLMSRDLNLIDSDKFLILFQNLSDEFLVSFVNYLIENIPNSSVKIKSLIRKLSEINPRYFTLIIDRIAEPLKTEIFNDLVSSITEINSYSSLDLIGRSQPGYGSYLFLTVARFARYEVKNYNIRNKYLWFRNKGREVTRLLIGSGKYINFTSEFFNVDNPEQVFADLNDFRAWVRSVEQKYDYDEVFFSGLNDEKLTDIRDSLIKHRRIVYEIYNENPQIAQKHSSLIESGVSFLTFANYLKEHEESDNSVIRSFFESSYSISDRNLFLKHDKLNLIFDNRMDIDINLNIQNANSYILAYGFRNNLLSKDYVLNFPYSSDSTFNQKMFAYFRRNFSGADSFNQDCCKFLNIKGLSSDVWRIVQSDIRNDDLVLSLNNQDIKTLFMRKLIERRESLSNENLEFLLQSKNPDVEGFAFRELLRRSDSQFSSMVGLRPDGSLPRISDVTYNNDSQNRYVLRRDSMRDFISSLVDRPNISLNYIRRLSRDRRYAQMARMCIEIYELRAAENPEMSEEQVLRSILSTEIDKLYKFDKRRGQGAIMHNLLAFRRIADYVRVPQGATSYSVIYPGGAYHLSGLQTVASILQNNPNLDSLNFTITEWKDYRVPILQYLKLMQTRGLISDLSDSWSVNTGSRIDGLVSSLSNLSFKINGKQVNFNYSFRIHAQNSSVNEGIDYLGRDNGNSDLVLIHDLDKGEDHALGNLIHYLRQNGGERTLVFPFDRLGDESYEFGRGIDYNNSINSLKRILDSAEDLRYEILYQNASENYGCHCLEQHAHGGMVVVRIQKIDQ